MALLRACRLHAIGGVYHQSSAHAGRLWQRPREILYDFMKPVVTLRDAYVRGRQRFQNAI